MIRTFVSGLGNDANTATFCSRQKPCRTLAAAYTVTEVGGEIVALDPGEFGPITITGRLSIFGTQNALIGVATGGTGVDTNVFPMTGPTQVRIAWGNAIGNNKAYVMNDPGTGSGGNKVTILEFLTSNTTAAFSTNVTGNGTLVSGTGASCGGTNCQNLGFYSSNTNPK